MNEIGNLTGELPIGVEVSKKSLVKEFTCKDLTGADIKLIHDRVYRKNHPLSWSTRVVSLILDNLGGHNVAADFRQSGYQKFPDIVKKITTADASYLLIAGHVHAFGPKLDEVKDRCDVCQRMFVTDIDLSTLPVERPETPATSFKVTLAKGVTFDDKQGVFDTKDKLFNTLEFRYPTLGDNLKNEQYFKPNDRGEFDDRTLFACLLGMETEAGEPLDEKVLATTRHGIWDHFSASDLMLIRREWAKIPSIEMVATQACGQCGEDTLVGVNPTLLYPRA